MTSFKLKRLVQCKNCPWKKGTDPFDIPDGYCLEMHRNLQNTIAAPESTLFDGYLKIMACHHSSKPEPYHCVGWLHNQIGTGNNIALLLYMMDCTNLNKLKIVGDQHETFKDTLPQI